MVFPPVSPKFPGCKFGRKCRRCKFTNQRLWHRGCQAQSYGAIPGEQVEVLARHLCATNASLPAGTSLSPFPNPRVCPSSHQSVFGAYMDIVLRQAKGEFAPQIQQRAARLVLLAKKAGLRECRDVRGDGLFPPMGN